MFSKKFKLLLAVVMMLAMTALFTACGGENNSQSSTKDDSRDDTIIIGTQDIVGADLISKHEKWYDTELGMKAKVVRFDSGRDIVTAFASNSVDIGLLGSVPTSLAIANNLDVEVVYVSYMLDKADALAAKNSSGITTLRDLVGKKVATTVLLVIA